uniref:ribosomal protein L22 n=1 Tax=Batis maritima TaxID=4436 RepID=UPI003001F653|nr:TPA_asm: ribosomal protein L22 [Batis maritima]
MIKKRNRKVYTEVYAFSKHIPISAHKARRVIDQIRGRSYEDTLMILELMPYRASYPIFKLVYSAAANASHNKGFDEKSLFISKAKVDEGNTIKKLKARARGRGYPIKKPTCHISIALQDLSLNEENENFFLRLNKTGWKNSNTKITYTNTYSNGGLWDKK